MSLMMKHYLFPISVFLLPKGVTQLRIFEPRYLRMIEACQNNGTGFVMAMQEGERICQFGTLVKVDEVYPLENNTLGITIRGLNIVEIKSPYQEEDGLWVGDTERTTGWMPTSAIEPKLESLSTQLRKIYATHPELSDLYNVTDFTDPDWVCSRFLEIIPLATNQKQWYLAQQNHQEALSFLTTMVISKQLH